MPAAAAFQKLLPVFAAALHYGANPDRAWAAVEAVVEPDLAWYVGALRAGDGSAAADRAEAQCGEAFASCIRGTATILAPPEFEPARSRLIAALAAPA